MDKATFDSKKAKETIYKIISPDYVLVKEGTSYRRNGELLEIQGHNGADSDALGNAAINDFYKVFFSAENRNLALLCGAGTSVDCGIIREGKQGMTREELWRNCDEEIKEITTHFNDAVLSDINFDLEAFLSRAYLLDKISDKRCDAIAAVEQKIREACKLTLGENSPQLEILNKLVSRKVSSPRVRIFTTNYDTLFEQAAAKGAFVVIDGFSYSYPREFSGRFFDVDFVNRNKTRLKNEDNFVPKVFHLYKLHGSLCWEKQDNNKIVQAEQVDFPLIVYPASDKFEQSYDQPYFEMMSRFQSTLREEDLMLIVAGFGFKDRHIHNAIIDAVHQNPGFQLVVLDYGNNGAIDIDMYANLGLIRKDAGGIRSLKNVTIIQGSFADFAERYPLNKTYDVSSNNE